MNQLQQLSLAGADKMRRTRFQNTTDYSYQQFIHFTLVYRCTRGHRVLSTAYGNQGKCKQRLANCRVLTDRLLGA